MLVLLILFYLFIGLEIAVNNEIMKALDGELIGFIIWLLFYPVILEIYFKKVLDK